MQFFNICIRFNPNVIHNSFSFSHYFQYTTHIKNYFKISQRLLGEERQKSQSPQGAPKSLKVQGPTQIVLNSLM